MQRAADIAAETPRVWRRERGDLSIPWDEAQGHLAIVIDDVGRELHVFEQLLSLRFPLTFAVLPGSVFTSGVQVRLQADRRRHREVLLHLPMEPQDAALMRSDAELRETFLQITDDAQTLQRKTQAALAAVPIAIGVNNHMGSRLTTDRGAMDAVMSELARRRVFFLDSRTTADTVAMEAATAAQVPTGSRHVFLDHEPGVAAIAHALALAAERASREPTIAIAHPTPE
ncbi:MAG: divergent polysaccharide deacetylase family protein, partial [Nannocystaceae bacterium]|nr:divergent polysaccharide deacetylase family protein [Nannocystaceae bacterium]